MKGTKVHKKNQQHNVKKKAKSHEERNQDITDNAFESDMEENQESEVNILMEDDDEVEANYNSLVPSLGLFDKKSKKKSGGFQSMGLSYPVLKGILRKGYKVPTPIQRKTIPPIIEGKDVVAMARTGSGKTGAFLIPMFEKLKARTSKVGARALIFSPTRELALQTMKFTKELGRCTKLKATLILGGEKIEDQFAAIHENPDIIIATPGRFLHIVIEMDLKLSSIQYVVFDEADRLLEMGFREQIEEVLHRLPEHRQTLMFSATLPKILIEFVKIGLTNPVLIRLDVEHKLSENLKTVYLCCRLADKMAILLHLLKNVVNLDEELTVIFFATRHHVEYAKDILSRASIPSVYVYSSLSQVARKMHVAEFRSKKVPLLLVTDVAARGIDIPLLDNVINYNFPAKPKLFVHRVGRVARAGRKGTAYSLVSPDEMAYLLDLHLFLGKSVTVSSTEHDQGGVCGCVPQGLIDDEAELLNCYHETSVDLKNMETVCERAYQLYSKSRPLPSSESIKRLKDLPSFSEKVHPMFHGRNDLELERSKFLLNMKNYRPNTTIFEIGQTAKSEASAIMRDKRRYHSVVDKIRSQKSTPKEEETPSSDSTSYIVKSVAASDSEIQSTFTSVVIKGNSAKSSKNKQKTFKDPKHYVNYKSSEHYTEVGLGVASNFIQDASKAVLDLTADDAEGNRKLKKAWQWDRKRKRFVKEDGSEMKKKMKTENGVWISKSYKSDVYKKWQERNKFDFNRNSEDSDSESESKSTYQNQKKFTGEHSTFQRRKGNNKQPMKRELKNKEEILKARKRKARLMSHQKKKHLQKSQKGKEGKQRSTHQFSKRRRK